MDCAPGIARSRVFALPRNSRPSCASRPSPGTPAGTSCRRRPGSHVHLATVLLHDAVADREAEPGALVLAVARLGFGGEERVVDAVQMLRLDASAEVLHDRGAPVRPCAPWYPIRASRPCMASRALSSTLSTTCCSLPSLPWMRGNMVEAVSIWIFAVLNGVRAGSAYPAAAFQVHRGELGAAGREKFSRPFTISDARKVCCVIFSSTGDRRGSCSIMGRMCSPASGCRWR